MVIDVTSADTGEATVDTAELTFTPANWNTAQTVTVTGADDSSVDGTQTTLLTLAVDDAKSDNAFDAVPDQSVSVATADVESFLAEVARLKTKVLPKDTHLDSRPYVVPDSTALTDFSNLAAALFANDLVTAAPLAASLNYELVEFTDSSTGDLLRLLREELDGQDEVTRGWGSYFLNVTRTANVLVEITHPLFDTNSAEVGAEAFLASDSRGFLMAGRTAMPRPLAAAVVPRTWPTKRTAFFIRCIKLGMVTLVR